MRLGTVLDTLDCGDRIYVEIREVGGIISTVNLVHCVEARSISVGDTLRIHQFEVHWTPKCGGFALWPITRFQRRTMAKAVT